MIYCPVTEQGIWRIITKQELRRLYEDLDIVADLKKKIGWVEHEEGRIREGQLTLWRRNFFFLILAHSVYKM